MSHVAPLALARLSGVSFSLRTRVFHAFLAREHHCEALLEVGGKRGSGRSRDSTGHRGDAIVEAAAMPLTIPDDVPAAAHITEPELKRELALALFQQERLTLAQASSFAEMSQGEFQHLLAERHIPVHYGTEEFVSKQLTLGSCP